MESDGTQVSSDVRSDCSDSSSTNKKKRANPAKKTKRNSIEGPDPAKDFAPPEAAEPGSQSAPPQRKKTRKSVEMGEGLKTSMSDSNLQMTGVEAPLTTETEEFVPTVLTWADNVGSPMSEVHILDYEYNRKGYPIRRRPQKVEMCTRTQKIVLIIAASIIGLIIIIMVIVLFSGQQVPASPQPVAPPSNIIIPFS